MDTIGEQLNDRGDNVVSYYCERVTANNDATSIDLVVPYYYDLVYPCTTEEPTEGAADVEAALLIRSKREFLPNAEACIQPRNPWFSRVSALPDDVLADFLPCQSMVAGVDYDEETTCCAVIYGQMTFTQLSTASLDTMQGWVAANVNDPADIAAGYQVKFIGSKLGPDIIDQIPDPPQQEQPPPPDNNGPDPDRDVPVLVPNAGNQDPIPQQQQQQQEDGQFTMVGILILIGMIMIFITTIVAILKRRNKRNAARDVDAAIAQSELGLHKQQSELHGEHIDTATWDDMDEQDIEVNVLTSQDDDNNAHLHIRDISNVSYQTREGHAEQNSTVREPHLNQHYRFDLAESHRNNVMGTYGADLFGPTQITVVPPYPMEETSESEVDSWAQTDGTVGSLDDDHRIVEDTETGEI